MPVATYRDMIGPLSIRGDSDSDADDAEEHENKGPPCEVGEAAVNGRYYRADKGDDPGKLHTLAISVTVWREKPDTAGRGILTMPMDMVASAKGSPTMRPKLKPDDL